MQEYLGYNDVALVPQYNNIDSRTQPNLQSWLTRNTLINIPIVAAPMDTVISTELAEKLLALGSIPIFHRFTSIEQQKTWIDQFGQNCFISAGINNLPETIDLLKYTGQNGPCKGVLIDIAHGHSKRMLDFIKELKSIVPDREIIAGSVATPMAVQDLYNVGVDAVRVGIGAGACCTTRIQTGFGLPMFTCVQECAKIASKLRIPIIADGGIEHPKDCALALAAGAMTVMMGKKFAQTTESASTKTEIGLDGKQYVKYRGQASADFQKDFYGKVKDGTVPEGTHFDVLCTGSVDKLIGEYTGALRSAFTYGGARDIKEFQRKAEFVKVGSSYISESHPRPF
jgi:IMP dehydrogenase